jgi:hypothetical protein
VFILLLWWWFVIVFCNFYFMVFLVGCGGGFGVLPKPSNAYLQSIEKMMGVKRER